MHKYFNPKKFVSVANKFIPFIIILTVLFLSAGLYYALWGSPPDYQQGEFVRIMYIHVPAAWMALGVYSFIAFTSIASIVWKNPLSDIIAISAAPAGALFAAICLVSGAVWGKPTWGTWWVWDARLTSMLILFFFYLGYIVLVNSFDDVEKASKPAAILAIIGFVNVPIVKFSVDWWNTLHQPASVIRSEGVAIHSSMLIPLILIFVAFIFYFLMTLLISVKAEIKERKINRKRFR